MDIWNFQIIFTNVLSSLWTINLIFKDYHFSGERTTTSETNPTSASSSSPPSSHQTTITTQPRPAIHVSFTTPSHTTPGDASEEEEEEDEEEKDKEPCDEEDQLDSSQENHPDGRKAGMFGFTSRFSQFFQWGWKKRNTLVNLMDVKAVMLGFTPEFRRFCCLHVITAVLLALLIHKRQISWKAKDDSPCRSITIVLLLRQFYWKGGRGGGVTTCLPNTQYWRCQYGVSPDQRSLFPRPGEGPETCCAFLRLVSPRIHWTIGSSAPRRQQR